MSAAAEQRASAAARCLAALAAALMLAACAPVSSEEDAAARAAFTLVRSGDFDALEPQLAPELRTAETHANLERVRTYIPNEAPAATKLLTNTVSEYIELAGGVRASERSVTTLHQYDFSDRIVLVETRIVTPRGGTSRIERFWVNAVDWAQVRANRFSWANKSWRHYAFFGVACASLCLMTIAFLGALLTRGFRRQWLWCILSLIGIGGISMDWATGRIEAYWAKIMLIGWGVMRGGSPIAPWIVQFTAPLGALVVISLLLPRWAGLRSEPPSPA